MDIYEVTRAWAMSDSSILAKAQETTSSTNDLAKQEALNISAPLVLYLTKHQEKGRGRFERVWEDQGSGRFLLSSWSIAIPDTPHPLVTTRIGLALIESFTSSFPQSSWSLKAPNDILLNGKKVCGILTEAVSQGNKHRLIVGIGVNVFDSPNIENASSLSKENLTFSLQNWHHWLDHLLSRLKDVALSSNSSELGAEEQNNLLKWLNRNPNLSEPYSAVEKDGSLRINTKSVPWEDI